jgi:hypothetical protein
VGATWCKMPAYSWDVQQKRFGDVLLEVHSYGLMHGSRGLRRAGQRLHACKVHKTNTYALPRKE